MPFYYGHLREVGGPVDPGFGQPGGPTDPGYGVGEGARPGHDLPNAPVIPGNLPVPPGVWPPLTPSAPVQPAHPIAGHPVPPGAIWPPVWAGGVLPPHVSGQPLPDPGHPSGQPVPPDAGTKPPEPTTYWVICGIPGVGWRYAAIDPSLVVGYPLPPTAEPK
jgi:hypothetical protein